MFLKIHNLSVCFDLGVDMEVYFCCIFYILKLTFKVYFYESLELIFVTIAYWKISLVRNFL